MINRKLKSHDVVILATPLETENHLTNIELELYLAISNSVIVEIARRKYIINKENINKISVNKNLKDHNRYKVYFIGDIESILCSVSSKIPYGYVVILAKDYIKD